MKLAVIDQKQSCDEKNKIDAKLGVGNGASTVARNASRKPRVDMAFLPMEHNVW
jgi:hypothetical protein